MADPTTTDSFRPLTSEHDLEQAYAQSEHEPVLLFKHSTACPISARANRELQKLGAEDGDPPVYRLVVQETRALSSDIADALDIRHETPQAILLHQKQPVFDASHRAVTARAVRKALRNASA